MDEILPESYSTSELNCLLNTKIKCEVEIDGKNIDLNLIQLNSFVIKNIKQVSEQFIKKDLRFYENYNELVTRLEQSLKEINKEWKKIAASPETLIIKEEKRLAKTLIDIFSKVLKKIKADFGPIYESPDILIDNIKKYVGSANPLDVSLLSVVKKSKNLEESRFPEAYNLVDAIISDLKGLDVATKFYLDKSGSKKLADLYKNQLFNLYKLDVLKPEIRWRLQHLKPDERGLSFFNGLSQDLKRKFVEYPRKEINKVVTFYSEDQRNAKKLLLELVDNYELVIAAALEELAKFYNIQLPEKEKTFFEKAKRKAANAKAELSANAAKLKKDISDAAGEWKNKAGRLLGSIKEKTQRIRQRDSSQDDSDDDDLIGVQ